jgi:hypothetical protein
MSFTLFIKCTEMQPRQESSPKPSHTSDEAQKLNLSPAITHCASRPSDYARTFKARAKSRMENGEHCLRRYLWRSFLTIVCPLVVLAFYASICLHFLVHPKSNKIFPSAVVNAAWVYLLLVSHIGVHNGVGPNRASLF